MSDPQRWVYEFIALIVDIGRAAVGKLRVWGSRLDARRCVDTLRLYGASEYWRIPLRASTRIYPMTDRDFAVAVVRRLREAGHVAYWAGGCVRDELLGETPADYDVATAARPAEVVALFRRTVEVGAAFGVVEVVGPRWPDGSHPVVQVATFRSDGVYLDGRRPESVMYSTAEQDAERRDFTINGMFFDPLDGQVIDYVGGRADLQARILRAIGDPRARFREDKLRLLRAVRLAARFSFPIEPATAAAVREMAPEITAVSAERIAEELRKMLAHPQRESAVRTLADLGLVPHVLPEVANDAVGWVHALAVIAALDGPRWPAPGAVTFPLAFAALLSAVGKAKAAAACRRLKLANDETECVAWLVERRDALGEAPTMRPSRLYPLLVHPGIGDLLALHRAIAEAASRPTNHVEFCERLLNETPAEVLNPPPLLTGDDLVALGWPPGPVFKRALDTIRAAQLDGTILTRDAAISLANTFAV